MAIVHGNDGEVLVGATSIGEITSFSLDRTVGTAAGNVMGDSAEKNIGGLETYSGSIECISDAADAGQSALVPAGEVTLKLYPAGNASGNQEFTVPALIESVSYSTAMDDMVKVTFSFKPDSSGTGITAGTVV